MRMNYIFFITLNIFLLLLSNQVLGEAQQNTFSTRFFQNFNPDISAIGDFLIHYSGNEGESIDDEFLFRELELGISASVDPYARADVFLGIHKELTSHHEESEDQDQHFELGRYGHDHEAYGIHIEEAYLTLLTLPAGLQAKFGKFKMSFGKANTNHLHALPWIDYPLVIQNFLGEEGFTGEGISINWLVPNHWNRFIELTYEVVNNDNGNLLQGEESDDFAHLLHVRNFFDLTECTGLEVGIGAVTGLNHKNEQDLRTVVSELDITLKWKPLLKGLYRSFKWRNELFFSQKEIENETEDAIGFYSSLEYQVSRRWTGCFRYDYSEFSDDANFNERALTPSVTFEQSEYCYWRIGYRYLDRNFEIEGNPDEHSAFIQLNFGLGPHRAHKY
ncbi:MAG: hypothetical protein A2161_05420 [Candidatus Schekmanbacteria bacterium RBG_13_48_7]|uniref:Zinc-regulated TonB-dependent outer membrane receptor n=1 Tax=Candidatus Schekmanbacteria bacterium RBG_13_48_7 TaxID=1817878 RepID=A0A1F7RN95_9BACT|nr:MAG: hypothetical protein A2161_05420 [Candidatus Schekmanbacteria bacterium RBG_13_48_7]